VVVLALKIAIVRYYKQFLKFVPVFGLIVFSLAFVVVVVSAVFFLVAGGDFGAGRPAVEAKSTEAPAAASGSPSTPVPGDASEGEALFARHCSFCHHADSDDAKIGPGLANLLTGGEPLSNGQPATPENVRAQLVDPVGSMPSFAETLSEAELDDMMAYLIGL
jgi:mono/diheme cytochrome c family protein